jgi:hypothetical protein
MATNDDYLRLRRMTGEDDATSKYTNADLEIFIANAGLDLNLAAATIWAEKAAGYADLVNVTEAGSSRSLSDLYKHAADQRDHFQTLADTTAGTVQVSSTTRPIQRA